VLRQSKITILDDVTAMFARGPNRGNAMTKPFHAIDPTDPRLALIPDQPGRAGTPPIAQPGPPKAYFIQRSREQRSPDRRASIERRRRLAASGLLPPQLAAQLTIGEQAVAYIVGAEFLAHGVCDLSRNAIAARAGCSHALAKRTLLLLERFGWLTVTRRPRTGRKHLANLTRITDAAWLTWLGLGRRKAAAIVSCNKARPDFQTFRGVQKSPPRSQVFSSQRNAGAGDRVELGKEALAERR
jgi:hypothetical protein